MICSTPCRLFIRSTYFTPQNSYPFPIRQNWRDARAPYQNPSLQAPGCWSLSKARVLPRSVNAYLFRLEPCRKILSSRQESR
jgi:hypothetical protein